MWLQRRYLFKRHSQSTINASKCVSRVLFKSFCAVFSNDVGENLHNFIDDSTYTNPYLRFGQSKKTAD